MFRAYEGVFGTAGRGQSETHYVTSSRIVTSHSVFRYVEEVMPCGFRSPPKTPDGPQPY